MQTARTTNEGITLSTALIVAVMLAALAIYFETAHSIVSIWNSSETFAHGYIIVPIAIWLVWQRRGTLRGIAAKPWWPGLALLALCGFAWLLAELGEVQVVKQYALVAMLPSLCIMILGLRLATIIAFPLCFLLLAVPFGDAFIEPLIQFTADFTVTALQLTGIPVWREGTNFVIPTGSWSVVTACSGVRYLIASFTLGCLYAYLTYQSWPRRLAFVALSIVVPIIANGLRAYMIVMIGHLVGMEHAVGVDHLIYGWVFFGVVMLLMFWVGSFWRDDDNSPARDHAEAHSSADIVDQRASIRGPIASAAIAALVCITLWPTYAYYIRHNDTTQTANLERFTSDWQSDAPFTEWKPRFFPANTELHRFYRNGEDTVGVSIRYYRNQHRQSMLISSSNQLVSEDDDHWRRLGSAIHSERVGSLDLAVRETSIEGPAGRILVWSWYWIDGKATVNDYLGKLLQAKEKLLMRGDDGAVVTVFAPYHDKPSEARAAMRAFLASSHQSLIQTLEANKERQEGSR